VLIQSEVGTAEGRLETMVEMEIPIPVFRTFKKAIFNKQIINILENK
jgi:hypothetical protein